MERFRLEGLTGLGDRGSWPRRCPLWRIARHSGCSLATLSRCIKHLGLSRLSSLQLPVPVVRYEHQSPGELLHIDTKRLGRIQGLGHRITGQRRHRNRGNGWDAVHLAIGDHSRVHLEFDKVAVTLSAEGASFSGSCSTLAILETPE